MSKGKENGTFGLRWKDVDPSLIVNNDRIWRNSIKDEAVIRNAWNQNFDFLVDDEHKRLERRATEMTHEKQHQHLNYTGDHLNSATVRRALNSEELLPKPPHLLNRVPSPAKKKKTKLESYYVHALPPQKINPNTLDTDKKKNEAQLEAIDRMKYTLNPYTTAQTSDLYNKKLQTKREKDESFKAVRTKPVTAEPEYDEAFESTFSTMMTRKIDGRAKEDLSQLTNGEYGSRATLETFDSHYTRYGRKKITFD